MDKLSRHNVTALSTYLGIIPARPADTAAPTGWGRTARGRPANVQAASSRESQERYRLDLEPGMTAVWQALGRDNIPFGEMVGLDYRDVTTWSIGTRRHAQPEDLRRLARSTR